MTRFQDILSALWRLFAMREPHPLSGHNERLRLLALAKDKVNSEGIEALLSDIGLRGDRYQSECSFLYCIDQEGRVVAHSISNGLKGADLRKQLNGEPLNVLEKILSKRTSRPSDEVHYYLNPRLRVEISYQTFGEFIVIAQSKLIPARSG